MTIEQAQADCDRFATLRGDTRLRRSHSGERKATVATVAARELLRPAPPIPYPLRLSETRGLSRQALLAYRGNQYSVPPELANATLTVTHTVGARMVDIATPTGIVVARHRWEPDDAGVQVRDHTHVTALNTMAIEAAAAARGPHRRKERYIAAPMFTAAFLPIVAVLALEVLGVDHELATDLGVITAAGLFVVVAPPGSCLHGFRGWSLALITFLIVAMTAVLVVAKVWLTH